MKDRKEHAVGLLGQGIIHQGVRRHLERLYRIVPLTLESSPAQLAACGMIVYCSDSWLPETLQALNQRCLQAGVALLPVTTQFEEGVVGPCVIPRRKGCTSCAALRTLGATSSEADRELLRYYLYEQHTPPTSQLWLSSFSREMLAVLAGEEIAAYFQTPDRLRTACAQFTVSLTSLDCRRSSFQPDPFCPDCGELVADSAELAAITLHSCPKQDAFTYRIKQSASAQQILSEYADPRLGLVCSLTMEENNLLPIAMSQLYSDPGDGEEMSTGTGCTLRPEQSQVVSVLESIERYAGLRSRSKRTVVQASYHQLLRDSEPALDPTTLGLHSPEQYAQYEQRHFCRHLVPYNHDLTCHWVWGYSFQKQSPILVPEHCAYYGVPISAENPAFVFDISNGCALGNSLEEAIFHGMLEVIERDAFLLTWYAQLGLPRLDLRSLTDPTLRLLVEHLEQQSGYTIQALNATLDHALPCLYLLGIDEQKRADMPKVHVMAGSHPHPEQALLRALREFTTSLVFAPQTYLQDRTEARAMLADTNLVQTMEHHPLVYYLPEAFERLNFLYQTPRRQTFQEAFHDFYQAPPERLDLRDDLEALIGYYLQRGTDTIVVDQSVPEYRPCGLRCVKVIMPGLLPMTFGQHNRRISGFERLQQLPLTLGYQDHPLTEAEINPYPHPFF